jgi:hypothetical protein
VAVIPLVFQSNKGQRLTYGATSPGAVAVGDTFKLSLTSLPFAPVKLLALRVAASGGTTARVDPAAYLDAARTATGKVWEGSWTVDDEAGLVFSASGGDVRLTLDGDGAVWIDPGLDANAGAVTVQISVEAA